MTKQSREIRIVGDLAYIPLTQGKEAIIDADDLHLIGGRLWCAKEGRNTFYAFRIEGSVGREKHFRMHRVIMGNPDKSVVVDHIDGNGLNNTRSNLRLVTASENSRNSKLSKRNTSGYKGVYWQKSLNKWGAKICLEKKQHFLGYFNTPEEAYEVYCLASKRLHGEFGRVV